MINPAFQGSNLTVRERFNGTMSFLVNNPHARNARYCFQATSFLGAGALIMCAAKENKFLPTDQCVMTEMPKFLAYGCSALGSYFLAKNLYPQSSMNILINGLDRNFRRLQNRLQRALGAVVNPQVDLVDNSQNGGGEAPLNSTLNPQQGALSTQYSVTAEIGVVSESSEYSTTDSSPRQPSAGALQAQSSTSIDV